MRHLFYLIGKSATGKDTIYEELLKDDSLLLSPLVPYTTRPIRAGEVDGQEYHFTDEAGFEKLQREGKVIEARTYQTVLGPWTYFTVDDGGLSSDECQAGDRASAADSPKAASGPEGGCAPAEDILGIGTLESYVKLRDYYGKDHVIPLYIEVDDGLRLERALKRERKPGNHKYEEMCRRFLADQADFSEEKLEEAGIVRRFNNDEDRSICIGEVSDYIKAAGL